VPVSLAIHPEQHIGGFASRNSAADNGAPVLRRSPVLRLRYKLPARCAGDFLGH
jgi:hypothetical protein